LFSTADYRERYGSVFVLELPDGLLVPFSLLSLADYFSYSKAFSAEIVPKSILENEIFQKCVKDEVLVDNIYKQKAGTPTVVANTILQYSAPQSSEELDYFLNYNREIVSNALYQVVNIICMAFSGYTPDDILSKDIHEITFLLALAERKMMESGLLAEPINFSGGREELQKQENPKQPKRPKVDVSKLRQEYEKQERQEFNIHKLKAKGKDVPRAVVEDETPKYNNDLDENGNVRISAQELMANDRIALEEEDLKMMKDAQWIFKDYLESAKKGEKIKIKTEEERIEEAKKRAEENSKRIRKRK